MSDTQRIEKLDPEELEKNRLAKEAAANKTPESTEAEPKQEAPVSAAEAAQAAPKTVRKVVRKRKKKPLKRF